MEVDVTNKIKMQISCFFKDLKVESSEKVS